MSVELLQGCIYTDDDQTVLYLAARIDGIVTVFFTSDAVAYALWMAPLRHQMSPDEVTAVDTFALDLSSSGLQNDCCEITGWAALQIIFVYEGYNASLGDCEDLFVSMEPSAGASACLFVTREACAQPLVKNDPMRKLNVPPSAVCMSVTSSYYYAVVIYGYHQVLDLPGTPAEQLPRLHRVMQRLQFCSVLPATSRHEAVVFGGPARPQIEGTVVRTLYLWTMVTANSQH